jgi:hypothetical protein
MQIIRFIQSYLTLSYNIKLEKNTSWRCQSRRIKGGSYSVLDAIAVPFVMSIRLNIRRINHDHY